MAGKFLEERARQDGVLEAGLDDGTNLLQAGEHAIALGLVGEHVRPDSTPCFQPLMLLSGSLSHTTPSKSSARTVGAPVDSTAAAARAAAERSARSGDAHRTTRIGRCRGPPRAGGDAGGEDGARGGHRHDAIRIARITETENSRRRRDAARARVRVRRPARDPFVIYFSLFWKTTSDIVNRRSIRSLESPVGQPCHSTRAPPWTLFRDGVVISGMVAPLHPLPSPHLPTFPHCSTAYCTALCTRQPNPSSPLCPAPTNAETHPCNAARDTARVGLAGATRTTSRESRSSVPERSRGLPIARTARASSTARPSTPRRPGLDPRASASTAAAASRFRLRLSARSSSAQVRSRAQFCARRSRHTAVGWRLGQLSLAFRRTPSRADPPPPGDSASVRAPPGVDAPPRERHLERCVVVRERPRDAVQHFSLHASMRSPPR